MTEYLTAAGSLTMAGPTGIMVSLGIESVAGVSLAMAYMYYNYIAASLMFFIAAMAGARSESRFLIILPLIGGLCMWFGWIHTQNNLTFLTFLIIVFLLGVFSYMNDVNHERYGIGGPGSKLLGIVFFLVAFQAGIGAINGFNMFPSGPSLPTPDQCQVGYTCDAYGNIDLQASVPMASETGGLFQEAVSIGTTLVALGIGALRMIITVLGSVLLFSVVLNSIISALYPGIQTSAPYVAFLALMQVGIWSVYVYTVFQWYYKPPVSEGSL